MSPLLHPLKDGRKILLREALPTDAAALLDSVKIILSTSDYTLTQVSELDLSIAEQVKRIDRYVSRPGHLILVALDGYQIVGNLDFKPNEKLRNRHSGEFGMGIIPAYRGLGLGKILLQALLDWAEEEPQVEKVCLGVYAPHQVARGLYEKMGFIEEGRSIRAMKTKAGEYVDEIRMYRWFGKA